MLNLYKFIFYTQNHKIYPIKIMLTNNITIVNFPNANYLSLCTFYKNNYIH